MTTYAPTVNPGDTRRRCRFIGITTPLDTRAPGSTEADPYPRLNVLEQQVILKKDQSEAVLQDLNGFDVTIDKAAMLSEYPEVDPDTDIPTGRMLNVYDTFVRIHSFVRYHQNLQNVEMAPIPTPTPAPSNA